MASLGAWEVLFLVQRTEVDCTGTNWVICGKFPQNVFSLLGILCVCVHAHTRMCSCSGHAQASLVDILLRCHFFYLANHL